MSPNSNNGRTTTMVVWWLILMVFCMLRLATAGSLLTRMLEISRILNGGGCFGQWFWKKGFGWNSTSDTVAERKWTVASLLFFVLV